jgi:hypothetical protein
VTEPLVIYDYSEINSVINTEKKAFIESTITAISAREHGDELRSRSGMNL